ncbi:MAG: ZIP family metal transporter [Gammaproteobacteria bacterium]
MNTLSLIVLFCFLGGALSVLSASVFLLFPEKIRTRMMPHLISFAIGALLGAAFLALLPHAMLEAHGTDIHTITLTVLLGILGFFALEKTILWRHCHHVGCEAHMPDHQETTSHATGVIVLLGDALHNLVDGVLIAAAFLTDTHLGIVTALAVAAHEIPQEVGDFAVLLHSGFNRGKAFKFNLLSSFTTVVGGVIAYFGLSGFESVLPFVLAIAASSFIYIAVADLIPGLHKRPEPIVTLQQVALIISGVLVIYVAHSTLH